ncbi:MAG: hypothetical protein KF691_12525 [Phycisphaeraceae bacterium]|nr:hypothetical protein [Phycisphaeraceae bacterium]
MDSKAAAEALFHTINKGIRSEVNRTVAFVKTGQPKTQPNPFDPKTPLVLNPVASAQTLHKRLAELGVNTDPQLLEALRNTIAEHLHGAFFNLFAALDGEGAIYDKDGTEVQLELRIHSGEPLPGYLHEIYRPADLT